MRNAYSLLGLAFFVMFVGVYFVLEKTIELPEKVVPDDVIIPEEIPSIDMALRLTSPAFEEDGSIPSKYTCDGENVNPELRVSEVPEGTQSLVLVMDDPDIPESVKKNMGIEKFDHWVLYNIPADTTVIKEASSVGFEGLTSRGSQGFVGSCPPDGEHRYIYRLYAVSGTLNFIKAPTLDEVEVAAKGMSIETTTLTGRYTRVSN